MIFPSEYEKEQFRKKWEEMKKLFEGKENLDKIPIVEEKER